MPGAWQNLQRRGQHIVFVGAAAATVTRSLTKELLRTMISGSVSAAVMQQRVQQQGVNGAKIQHHT